MYYVCKENSEVTMVAGYRSQELALRNNPGVELLDEDNITAGSVGFPSNMTVCGYMKNRLGSPATATAERNGSPYELYARTADGNWTLVKNCTSLGASQLLPRYTECVLLETAGYTNKSARELIGTLYEGNIVEIEKETIPMLVDFLADKSGAIYDE